MRRFSTALALGTALAALSAVACADAWYTLQVDPPAQSVRVSVTIDKPGDAPEFRIPAWCPGYYMLLRYQEKVSGVSAVDASGRALKVRPTGSRGWSVENPAKGAVTLRYSVLGDDPGLGFFGVNVRSDTAFVNGPAAFMYCDGHKEEPVHLNLKTPEGWDVATPLEKGADGQYSAGGYDELLDSPLQMGKMVRRSFQVRGVPFELVLVAPGEKVEPDPGAMVKQLAKVVEPALELFGGAAFKRYTFIIHLAVGGFAGGLEHRASTVIAQPNYADLDLSYMAAHEYFHAWNVKQIRPVELGPFDYARRVPTPLVWFAEGVTDYYAYRGLYRAGLLTREELCDTLGRQVDWLQRGQTRKSVSLEYASDHTWEAYGLGYGDMSFYNKGLLVGLILDAAIRDATDDKRSLDDVMRLLFERRRLPKPGYTRNDLSKTIHEVAGKDLSSLLDAMTQTTQELPYELLAAIGLRVRSEGQAANTLGFELNGDRVSWVDDETAAQGVARGDRVLVVNGKAFGPGAFAGVDGEFTVTLQRGEATKDLKLRTLEKPADYWTLELDPFANARAARLRESYLARPAR